MRAVPDIRIHVCPKAVRIVDYNAAIAYITEFIDYERSPDFSRQARLYNLNRISRLLALLGNPQERLRVVHVAGSKGKGSTAALISSILSRAGYKTGLFTSPHLITPRERCRIDGELISESDVALCIKKMRTAIDEVSRLEFGRVSFFEIYTALAFCYFADKATDFAVVEVGLGGRLDATNVVNPVATVITPIGLEHTAILGETHAAIAAEKAEIIKPGCPLALAPQVPEAQDVFERVAAERNAPIVAAKASNEMCRARGQSAPTEPPGQHFDVEDYPGLFMPLLGEHQRVNAATAIAGIECLNQRGYAIPCESVYQGIAQVEWPGRMQVIQGRPIVLLDGAHSPEAMQLLCREIRRNFRYNRLVFVVSLMRDKAVKAVGEIVCQEADAVIVTEVSDNPRVMPAHDIQRAWQEMCQEVTVSPTPKEALKTALALASSEDLVCVTGSLYLVGEVLHVTRN